MKKDRSVKTACEAGRSDVPSPLRLAVLGPVLGLGYFVLLPCLGIAAFAIGIGYQVIHFAHGLGTKLRGATKTPVNLL